MSFFYILARFPRSALTVGNTEKTVLKDCSKLNSQADKNQNHRNEFINKHFNVICEEVSYLFL